MAYPVQTLITDLGSVIHGTKTSKIPNLYGHISRAARQVLLDVDPKETQRILQLAQVFNDVYDYPAPVDLKGDRIVDLRPQAGRQPWEIFTQGYSLDFDVWKAQSLDDKMITQWNTGVKTLRIQAPTLTTPIVLSDTGTLEGAGIFLDGSNLTLDTVNNVAGGGALTFDLNQIGTLTSAELIVTASAGVDLSSHVNVSTLFLWVYLPNAAGVQDVELAWGSTENDLYATETSVTQQGTPFQNGWNLLAFPWFGADVDGTPDPSNINTFIVVVDYDGTAQTGVKVDYLTSALGYIFEMQYYSKYLFRDPSTNAFQETVVDATDNTKLINLDTESYNLLFNKTAFYIAQALQGADAEYDATFWDAEYMNALKRYQALNPAETILKTATYYQLPRNGYGGSNRFFRAPNNG